MRYCQLHMAATRIFRNDLAIFSPKGNFSAATSDGFLVSISCLYLSPSLAALYLLAVPLSWSLQNHAVSVAQKACLKLLAPRFSSFCRDHHGESSCFLHSFWRFSFGVSVMIFREVRCSTFCIVFGAKVCQATRRIMTLAAKEEPDLHCKPSAEAASSRHAILTFIYYNDIRVVGHIVEGCNMSDFSNIIMQVDEVEDSVPGGGSLSTRSTVGGSSPATLRKKLNFGTFIMKQDPEAKVDL